MEMANLWPTKGDTDYIYNLDCHIYGRSQHLDFIIQRSGDKASGVVGFTLLLGAGLNKAPKSLSEASEMVKAETMPNIFRKLSDHRRKILALEKDPEPLARLGFEGVATGRKEKGLAKTEVNYKDLNFTEISPVSEVSPVRGPAYFVKIDKGTLTYGTQKGGYREWCLDGSLLKGIFTAAKVATTIESGWLFAPKWSGLPYTVVGSRYVNPPLGMSGLPKSWKSSVPIDKRWWTKTSEDNAVAALTDARESYKKEWDCSPVDVKIRTPK